MKHLPNLLTTANLICGCMVIIALIDHRIQWVFFLLPLALVFDFLDGLTARWLKAYSDLGKQLDSLADMISFGLVPGMIFYYLLNDGQWSWNASALPAFLYTACAAWRLGKFNIDERQHQDFIGLATPGAAFFVLGLLYWQETGLWGLDYFLSARWMLYVLILFIGAMMLAEIPMFGFKINRWQWAGNEIKFIFVLIAIGLLAMAYLGALPIIVLIYIGFSLWNKIFKEPK